MKYSYYISEDFFRDQLQAVQGHAGRFGDCGGGGVVRVRPAGRIVNRRVQVRCHSGVTGTQRCVPVVLDHPEPQNPSRRLF